MVAARFNFDECVDCLLQNGADCNVMTNDGFSPLHYAIKNDNLNCIKILLDKMDETIWKTYDYRNVYESNFAKHQQSPLHQAICLKRFDIVQLILQAGVNPNPMYGITMHYNFNNRCVILADRMCPPPLITPLGLAACMGYIKIVVALLEAGAQINPELDDVVSPLTVAVSMQNLEVVEFFLKNGAEPNFYSANYSSDLQPLKFWQVLPDEILHLLLKHGADVRAGVGRYFTPATLELLRLFPNPAALENYIVKRCVEIPDIHEGVEKHIWEELFENSKNPPFLKHLCRLKIRKYVINNGSREFPIAKRLGKLPHLPTSVSDYLAYN